MPLYYPTLVTRLTVACLIALICSPAPSAERLLKKPEKTSQAPREFGAYFKWLDDKTLITASRDPRTSGGRLGARPGVADAPMTGALRVWDVETGTMTRQTTGVVGAQHLVMSRDQKKVACTGWPDLLQIWDVTESKLEQQFDFDDDFGPQGAHRLLRLHHVYDEQRVAFAPEGDAIAIGADFGIVIVDIASKKFDLLEVEKKLTTTGIYAIGFSGDGKTLFGRHDDVIDVWEWPSRQLKRSIVVPKQWTPLTTWVAISHDGKRIASADDRAQQGFHVWDTATGKLHSKTKAKHKAQIWQMEFAPRGNLLITESARDVLLWDVDTGERLATIPPSKKSIRDRAIRAISRR
jgi:WD40 repeat protein